MYLVVKKQDAKYGLFVSRVKCNKQGESIAFRRWKLSGKVHVIKFQALEPEKSLNVT